MAATLDSITIQGSSNFQIVSPLTFPYTTQKADTLKLRYAPQSSTFDSTYLTLHFHVGLQKTDTIIKLYGMKDISTVYQVNISKFEFLPAYCRPLDSVIIFSLFDSCTNEQATLLAANISSISDFSVVNPPLGVIHPNDSLIVRYQPQSAAPDTAYLLLRFQLGGVEHDTSILLIGSGKLPAEKVQLNASFTNNNIPPGGMTDLIITPDKAEVGKGLDSISFDLLYNGDLLTETNVSTQVVGASILPSPLTPLPGRARGTSLVIRGNNLSLHPTKAIADVTFRTSLTDTNATNVSISNLKLNSGDPTFSNCILSADTSVTIFTLALECSDTTIQQFLRTRTFRITSIRPNPASGLVTIQYQLPAASTVSFVISDMKGVVVANVAEGMQTGGEHTLIYDAADLANGVYFVRLVTPEGSAGCSLSLQK
jgi:hypothetical protein